MVDQKGKQSSDERRQFVRLNYRKPLKFRSVREKEVSLGTTSNVSRSGILFESRVLPKISSILWMDLDMNTLDIAPEVKDHALAYDHGYLGRVVRIEENLSRNNYNIGICFVTKDSAEQQEFKF